MGLFWFLFQKFFFLTLSKAKTLPSVSQLCPFLHTEARAASGRRGLGWRRQGSCSCAPSPAAGAVGVPAASAPRLQAQPSNLRAPGGCARPGQQGAAARGACQDADGAEEEGSCHEKPCSCSCVHPEAGGSPRCTRTVVASSQNPAAPSGKWPGVLWPRTHSPRDPGCARSAPRPLLAPRPCRGCGSQSRASGGSRKEGTRSCFSALGTEETIEGGPRRP